MKSILIMCYSDPSSDPRPHLMARCLKDDYRVFLAGLDRLHIDGVEDIVFPPQLPRKFIQRLIYLANVKLGRFDKIIWSNEWRHLKEMLLNYTFDLIIAHDAMLLPIAVSLKNAKVLLDAREYYPRHYEDRFLWRFLFQTYNGYLCSTYLQQCDSMITVSEGLAQEYGKEFGVKADVIMSLSPYHDIPPTQMDPNRIRIIHHGGASPSRRIEGMIELMDHVDERFTLDLILISGHSSSYYRRLCGMARKRQNVRVIPPVPYHEIIPFTNRYDIGLFLVPPTTFNLKHTLPNKLFEFIQARLAVAIGPSIEMRKIVEKYDCGVVSGDFDPRTLARELNKLTAEKIMYYKEQSDKTARELNADKNKPRIKEIVRNLIGD